MEIDVVVFATGYRVDLSFLDSEILSALCPIAIDHPPVAVATLPTPLY
ncbi:hypothetical protein VOI32_38445 [Paraburkholderia caribensis]|uniref:Uncharacterized protein n=1 Tax=Paraburkholderia caribensis TaxID=75105 RepID=A0ABV0E8J3_9BURK|nr:hypothetical protein [Paraburkholderia caribensis]MCO4882554.1 hypothetical protein [Paraburkholderia caribensis]